MVRTASRSRQRRHDMPAAFRVAATAIISVMAMIVPRLATAEPITSPTFPGLCVSIGADGAADRSGSLLRLTGCDSSAVQNFQFDQATSTLRMPQQDPVQCLDLSRPLGGPVLNGTGAIVNACRASPAQGWTFPVDGRIRSVGVDPNKCLTQSPPPAPSAFDGPRPTLPATGWVMAVSVLDPGCEFPEVGGGGFCAPVFGLYTEMNVASCDGRATQSWRLAQPGFPFPPDGIVSSKVHVTVSSMHIDDCREVGSCDWKLHCGLGPEADVEMFGKVEKNTGGTIDVRRDLVHEGPLPVTVTCTVAEFDRGILDPDVWERIGTTTMTFGASGPASMGMDRADEGKVTINFNVTPVGVIQQPSTVEPTPVPPTKPETLLILKMVGFDTSVPEADLRDWLGNPQFTPYPAISQALVRLLQGKRLRRPVFLDVIVFNYEHAPGVASPRRLADVDMNLLAKAVVEGHNTRYDERVTDFQTLLR